MAASLVELSDAASVDRAARALFGSSLDTRPAVSHSAAVWRADEEEPVTSIRINEHGPKSDLDFLALHIGRARADGIIITGKILREEPALTYDLRADPRWGDALVSWRERRWGLTDPPWLLILTSRGEIDFDHPIFHADVRPLIFTTDRAASRRSSIYRSREGAIACRSKPALRRLAPCTSAQCWSKSCCLGLPRSVPRRTRQRSAPGEAFRGAALVSQRDVRHAPRKR
jgi:hypothetical protein